MRLLRLNRFAVSSFLCVIAMALVMGVALSSLLSRAVLDWEWENTRDDLSARVVALLRPESRPVAASG